MNLYFKHKAGKHDQSTVQASLKKLGLPYRVLGPGLIEVRVQLLPSQYNRLKLILLNLGLELVDGTYAGQN